MSAVTVMGMTADPDEFGDLAGAVSAGEAGWRGRLDALPGYILTPETLAGEPGVIAGRLREIAGFLERWRDGTAFTYPGLAAQAAVARERARDAPFTFGGRRR